MKVKEYIEVVNNEKALCLFDVPVFEQTKVVAEDLDVSKHRHYETSTMIIECEDGFVGVTGPSDLFSDMSARDDIGEECYAEEYEKVNIVSYKKS